jgi:hypothetical protein
MTLKGQQMDRLSDRAAIQEAINNWCRAVDRRDWDMVRAAFHPDGTDAHGLYDGDVDGLIDWLKVRHATITSSNHVVSNILIEFYGPDAALVETYCTACQRYAPEGAATLAAISGGAAAAADNPVDMLIFGRYVDRFERRDGQWKVFRRITVFDNSLMFAVPTGGAKMGANWTVGRRDQEDTIYKLRRELGLDSQSG